MSTTREHTRTERRLAEVDDLAQSLDQLAHELADYKEVLQLQLKDLRQEIANGQSPPASAPARPQTPVRARPTIQGEVMPLPAERTDGEHDGALLRGLEESADRPEAPVLPASSGIHRRPMPAPPEQPAGPRQGSSGFRKSAPPLNESQSGRPSDSGAGHGNRRVAILISDGLDDDAEPIPGWVVERSANMLRLRLDDQLVVGSVYSIHPAQEHPNAQWVQISIKSCNQERGRFSVVAQFVKRPPWTALALL